MNALPCPNGYRCIHFPLLPWQLQVSRSLSAPWVWPMERLLLALSLYWSFSANGSFFHAVFPDGLGTEPALWGYALALQVLLTSGHFFLLALFCHARMGKAPLLVLIVATALAQHFMAALGIYLDPAMLRNVLHTDWAESRELLSWALLHDVLLTAGPPTALLWGVQVRSGRFRRRLWVRLLWLAGSAAVALAALLLVFQPFASLMRQHKEVRYLMTPANFLWSFSHLALHARPLQPQPRQAIGLDAHRLTGTASARPLVVVWVVGETARAANWGLNGYARQTTPQLAKLPVFNFPDTRSCGTSTEVSLPCMFSPGGRHAYDEERIRSSESLLHVLARAGVNVHWRDNQSGCKGVCEGLPGDRVADFAPPGLCHDGHCLDEGLLQGLEQKLDAAQGAQLWVLHQIGNHGPAYFRRYPHAFRQFQPGCEHDDLSLCHRQEIINSYDNALLYTDDLLARLIRLLQAHEQQADVALVYVSDHGESLGEGNLFLHGLPYAIAPSTQTRVPMVWWLSDGLLARLKLDRACLQQRSQLPVSHDHLFHTLLDMLGVKTRLYQAEWDVLQGCKAGRVS